MQFTRLSLAGFKSFVDRTELAIEPGLTGIVGPNGCGKSNLVEALRWVMGENSAKRMRGGEMDDVIFGGTGNRPARNVAEVALLVERAGGTAAPDVEPGEIEVTRRIERGAGSDFRVNGREVRARDVQLLFADAATGAHSTALVSQGRIGAIINAKPAERRGLLEEAAGISGLHSRRHEAELRLKAADANLERLDDVLTTLQTQFETLKKQARQAGRYRRLSEHVRRAEAVLLHLRWQQAVAAEAEAATRLRAAEREVGALTEATLAAERRRGGAAEALPALRQAEAAAAAELQRLVLAREALEAEETRVLRARGEAERRLQQLAQDRAREDELASDAAAALARLAAERAELDGAATGEAEAQEAAGQRLREAAAEVAAHDAEVARLTEALAATEARRATLARQQGEAAERHRRLAQRLAESAAQRRSLESQLPPPERLAAAAAALAEAEEAVERSRAAALAAETGLAEMRAGEGIARAPILEAEAVHARLRAEAEALRQLLAPRAAAAASPPLLDAVKVAPGCEAALAAALGDDLAAPLDRAAPRHWQALPDYPEPPALPAGIASLADQVTAPPALDRRLRQIGLLAEGEDGAALAVRLAPGQRLVSRAGALWRWDGFAVAAGAPSATAQRLQQRNRLAALAPELQAADERLAQLRAALAAAQARSAAAASAEAAARQAMREALTQLAGARDRHNALGQQETALTSRLAGIAETEQRLAADLQEAAQQGEAAAASLGELADPARGREELAARRSALAERRSRQLAAQGELDRLLREAAARRQRLAAILLEERSWQSRAAGAERQRAALAERHQALAAEIEALAARPAEIAAQRERLAATIAVATERRRAAGDALATGETALAEAEKAEKQAGAALGEAREERVRCEAAAGQAAESRAAIRARIAERLDCAPEAILAAVEVAPDEALPELADAEARLERLVRERDGMGPVNLVAESEAEELEARIAGLAAERADLTAAIARLRQGIGTLNHEGRERLLAAFAKVNGHFEQLFVRLFGGGRAHLALGEGEDPLEAGLEIMASPPGKKLQVLSLLSGGEQALTALALLFAVFLTNPAPICVLDEVDAPLDDANVDRFCRLVEEIAASSETRFLVITHHRVTMARMDRLFGVTMAERGVSQLVSVDLQAAERLRRTA